jgi:AraC family transcriptional regulator
MMKTPATSQSEANWFKADQSRAKGLPISASQSQSSENMLVGWFQYPAGEANCHYSDEHSIYMSLVTRPVCLVQIQGGKTYAGLYVRGDISIIPAAMPVSARWEADDNYLQIRIASQFIQQVAKEALEMNGEHLNLLAKFRARDPHIEAIGMMLLTELQQGNTNSKLYIDSLSNVLAVHLIRHYTATESSLLIYQGGLSQRQLKQVLDYIRDYLDQNISLADLAALLNVSQFHFSHQFKQTLGVTPYQYLLQQRIERAKQLLKQSNRSITDIALLCGFNSHSHLSKQFRQVTGMTPKVYRLHLK